MTAIQKRKSATKPHGTVPKASDISPAATPRTNWKFISIVVALIAVSFRRYMCVSDMLILRPLSLQVVLPLIPFVVRPTNPTDDHVSALKDTIDTSSSYAERPQTSQFGESIEIPDNFYDPTPVSPVDGPFSWGTYRTGSFLGIRSLSQLSPLIGLMWHDDSRIDYFDHIRHDVISDDSRPPQLAQAIDRINGAPTNTSAYAPVNEGVSRVEYTRAHPAGYGVQSIVDRDVNITTEFTRLPGGQFRATIAACIVGHCGPDAPAPAPGAPVRSLTLLPYVQAQHAGHAVQPLDAVLAAGSLGRDPARQDQPLDHLDARAPFAVRVGPPSRSSVLVGRPVAWSEGRPVQPAPALELAGLAAAAKEHIKTAKRCIDREPASAPFLEQVRLRRAGGGSVRPLGDGLEAVCGSEDGIRVAQAIDGYALLPYDAPLPMKTLARRTSYTTLPVPAPVAPQTGDGPAALPQWASSAASAFPEPFADVRRAASNQIKAAFFARHRQAQAPVREYLSAVREHRKRTRKLGPLPGVRDGYFHGQIARQAIPFIHAGLDNTDRCAAEHARAQAGAGSSSRRPCATVWATSLQLPFRYELLLADEAALREGLLQREAGEPAANPASSNATALDFSLTPDLLRKLAPAQQRLAERPHGQSPSPADARAQALLPSLAAVAEALSTSPHLLRLREAAERVTAQFRAFEDMALGHAAELSRYVALGGPADGEIELRAPAQWVRTALASLVSGLGFHEGGSAMRVTVRPAEFRLLEGGAGAKARDTAAGDSSSPHPLRRALSGAQGIDSPLMVQPPAYLAVPRTYQSLLTLSPSRQCFPRGFLWDEGFHQLAMAALHPLFAQQMLTSWASLTHPSGWVPREQILGGESASRVPEQFRTQYDDIANPPTHVYAVARVLKLAVAALHRHQRTQSQLLGHPRAVSEQVEQALGPKAALLLSQVDLAQPTPAFAATRRFLGEVLPALRAQLSWFVRSQTSRREADAEDWDMAAADPSAAPDLPTPDSYSFDFAVAGRAVGDLDIECSTDADAGDNASPAAPEQVRCWPKSLPRPRSLAWRQRSRGHGLASGLDDYPRLPVGPSPLVLAEGHADAAAWGAGAAGLMAALEHVAALLAQTGDADAPSLDGVSVVDGVSVEALVDHADAPTRSHARASVFFASLAQALQESLWSRHWAPQGLFADYAVVSPLYTDAMQRLFDAGAFSATVSASVKKSPHAATSARSAVTPSPAASSADPVWARQRQQLQALYSAVSAMPTDASAAAASTSPFYVAVAAVAKPKNAQLRAVQELSRSLGTEVRHRVTPGHHWLPHLGYVALLPLFTRALTVTLAHARAQGEVQLHTSACGDGVCVSWPVVSTAADAALNADARAPITKLDPALLPDAPSAFPALLNLTSPPSPVPAASPARVASIFAISRLVSLLGSPAILEPSVGLRSLSYSSPYHATGENYWRGSAWIPINYLAERALDHYASLAALWRARAETLMRDQVASALEAAAGADAESWARWGPALARRVSVLVSEEVGEAAEKHWAGDHGPVAVRLAALVQTHALTLAGDERAFAARVAPRASLSWTVRLAGLGADQAEVPVAEAAAALAFVELQCRVARRLLRAHVTAGVERAQREQGFFYEQYDSESGRGRRCKPFTGWTALAALMRVEAGED